MFARKFLDTLDSRADQLTQGLLQKIARSGNCPLLLSNVPRGEQKASMRVIYGDLAEWLLRDSKPMNKEHYVALGRRRAEQAVPFSELLAAVCAAREYFWEYVEQETLLDSPSDLWGGVKVLRSLDVRFDAVLCCAAVGYEQHAEQKVRSAADSAGSV